MPVRLQDRRLTVQGLLLGAAALDIIFPLVVAVLDATEAIDPVRRTLSLHALRPGFPWMSLAFLAHAFALEMLAAGLRRLPPRPYAAPVLLRLSGASAALLAIFHPDPTGVETTTGHLHEALALVAFLGIAAAGLFQANAQRREPVWQGKWKLSAWFAVGLLVSLAALGLLVVIAQFAPLTRGYYGLGERIAVGFIGAWLVTTAVEGSRLLSAEAPMNPVPPMS